MSVTLAGDANVSDTCQKVTGYRLCHLKAGFSRPPPLQEQRWRFACAWQCGEYNAGVSSATPAMQTFQLYSEKKNNTTSLRILR